MGKARRNVAHHYDLSDTLYSLFLDKDRRYSCAYFTTDNDSLEVAQDNKKRHIAAKLLLRPGDKVLDIGSGWGGLALYLAQVGAVEVTGVTLSAEQHKVSERRAAEAGLSDRVRFYLGDYREEADVYDRIVSVGMFEHVGKRNHDEFFQKVRDLLTEDGVTLLHSIGRFDEPSPINPFIRNTSSPASMCRRCQRCYRRWSDPACWSRISKYCGCITPIPCASGTDDSKLTATRWPNSTTSGSAACESSTSSVAR